MCAVTNLASATTCRIATRTIAGHDFGNGMSEGNIGDQKRDSLFHSVATGNTVTVAIAQRQSPSRSDRHPWNQSCNLESRMAVSRWRRYRLRHATFSLRSRRFARFVGLRPTAHPVSYYERHRPGKKRHCNAQAAVESNGYVNCCHLSKRRWRRGKRQREVLKFTFEQFQCGRSEGAIATSSDLLQPQSGGTG